jgi:hypothetical protein
MLQDREDLGARGHSLRKEPRLALPRGIYIKTLNKVIFSREGLV